MSEPVTQTSEPSHQFKRANEIPDDDTSPAKRIRQSREDLMVTRKAEKEQREAERRAEKEKREAEKRLEKERKDAERKAEKERRELERKAERERKDAERRAEKERKEVEKAAEKERKEAEKLAEKERRESEKAAEKERKLKAQPRINLFFKKSESTPVDLPVVDTPGTPQDPNASHDYASEFLPFHAKIDGHVYSSVCNCDLGAAPDDDPIAWLKALPPLRPSQPITTVQFRGQLALAQESSQVAALLAQLRVRRLQFSRLSSRHIENSKLPVNEEFRPPYVGTTRDLDSGSLALLACDPFRTDLDPALNYDYDSEVEWDQEDGDDLRCEDGDDSDDDVEDSEEMRGFLSTDEDDPSTANRQHFVGLLTPLVISDRSELARFSVELFSNTPMDPLKPVDESLVASVDSRPSIGDASLDEILSTMTTKVGLTALKECMALIDGSQANKTLLIELMKQRLPSATEREVRSVLDKSAERVGKKKSEKRWLVLSQARETLGLESLTVSGSGSSRPVDFFP